MMDLDIHVVWAEGQEWVVKEEENRYSYRLEGEYGEWLSGTPPGIFERDMDITFHELRCARTNYGKTRPEPSTKPFVTR